MSRSCWAHLGTVMCKHTAKSSCSRELTVPVLDLSPRLHDTECQLCLDSFAFF